MTELKYLEVPSGGNAWCVFPYYSTTNTSIVFDDLYVPIQPSGNYAMNIACEGPGRFQVSNNPGFEITPAQQNELYVSARFFESYGSRFYYNLQYNTTTGINGKFEVGNAYMKIDDVTVATGTTYTGSTITLSQPFYLFNHFNWNHNYIRTGHCGKVSFYENGVLAATYTPYLDDNNVAGFYDENNQTMIYSSGNAWVAGPEASSIKVEPSIKVVGFAGETVSASVQTENYWVASIADGSWLSIDAESGTGNTVVNISIDPNYDTSARTDTITFTDMNTTDEAVLTIKQKKYTDGQPMYLGGDEITEFYLGANAITEMYLGTELVFSVSAGGGGDEEPEYCHSESPDYNEDACSCIQNGGMWIEDGENSYCDDGRMPGECDSPECEECVAQGGIWVVPEFGDPYCESTPDYCDSESEDYNEDACNCISAGGTWEDGGGGDWGCTCESEECNCVTGGGVWDDTNQECIYPE